MSRVIAGYVDVHKVPVLCVFHTVSIYILLLFGKVGKVFPHIYVCIWNDRYWQQEQMTMVWHIITCIIILQLSWHAVGDCTNDPCPLIPPSQRKLPHCNIPWKVRWKIKRIYIISISSFWSIIMCFDTQIWRQLSPSWRYLMILSLTELHVMDVLLLCL